MTYATPQALRMGLEQRLLNQSNASGVSLDRLRGRVIFERIVARLVHAAPGDWVLKGGVALEVRLRDDARLTKDIDLGLRAEVSGQDALQERLVEALGSDPYEDGFVFTPGTVSQLREDGTAHVTWRSKVAAYLAGKQFGGVHLDISPRTHELDQTETVALPNSLAFAGIDVPMIEIIDIQRHAAEKFHAMLKDFGDRENTRVRDLIDLVLLWEHELLDPDTLRGAVERVWRERDGADPPRSLPQLPTSWPERYELIAAEHDVTTASFADGVAVADGLWSRMFENEET